MYKSDKPLETREKDTLNRAHFAESLAESLINYNDTQPLNIGITGPWGTGKTSLINMMVDCVQKETSSSDNAPIIMMFNPWNFTSKEQLLIQFFADFFSKISPYYKSKRELFNTICNYSSFILPLTDLATGGAFAKSAVDIINKILKSQKSLESQKKKIIEILSNQKRKILVIIDDIDRLTFDEIRLIFRLVSSIANFPNMIFILSFDREIVAKALQNEQEDGDRYLEKIIQVSIEIPTVTSDQRLIMFNDAFSPYLEKRSNMIFEDAYWHRMHEYVFDLIQTPRDIVRLRNSIDIKMQMIGDDINFVDLVLITLIEQKYHKLYTWISRNKTLLTDKTYHSFERMNSKADLEKENAKAQLENLKINMLTDQLVELIADMFPVFADSIGMRLSYDSSHDFLIKKQRIGAKDKFDRYFVFDINHRQISRSEVADLIYSMSENQAESFLKSAAANNRVADVIHEIKALKDEINQGRSLVLAGALIKSIHTFHGSTGDLIIISAAGEAEALMLDLLENVKDPKERYLFIKAVISEANENTIGVVVSIVHHIAMGIGRIKSDNGDRYHFIDASEQFDEIWKLYVEKIKEINQRQSILTVFKSRLALMLIKWVDDDQYCTLVKELLAKDTNLLRFVCMHVQSYASERFEADELEDVTRFASEAEIRQIISSCMRDDRFEELSAEEQNKVAAFILLQNTAVVSKQDCENLLKTWKAAG